MVIDDTTAQLASLATFRELFNNEKDIFDVLAEFLNEIIYDFKYTGFTIIDITDKLNKKHDFTIPPAVVTTALSRLKYLTRSNGKYNIKENSLFPITHISELHTKLEQEASAIIKALTQYIKEQNKNDEINQDHIAHALCSFLLDDTTVDKYKNEISSFIVKNQLNKEFSENLQKIKEGVILYSGIKYSNNINNLGTWDTDLTIYLDTEILFHIAGYNDKLSQLFANDLLSLVKDVNRKSKKIHLKYFNSVHEEIEEYFSAAEKILRNGSTVDPRRKAMLNILEGCKEASDVQEKKAKFDNLLKNEAIYEDREANNRFTDEANYKYHFLSPETLEEIKHTDFNDVDLSSNYRDLVLINILRKGRARSWEETRYILLTGKGNTFKLMKKKEHLNKDGVPLAVHINFLTSRFWFKLKKGFGGKNNLTSFSLISKARIILSNALNTSLGNRYDEIQQKYKAGTLTSDEVKTGLAQLRSHIRNSEEINQENIHDILEDIKPIEIEHRLAEFSYLKNKANDFETENLSLKQSITEKEQNEITLNQKLLAYQLQEKKAKRLEQSKKLRLFMNQEFKNIYKYQAFNFFYTLVVFTIAAIPYAIIYLYLKENYFNIDKNLTRIIGCVATVYLESQISKYFVNKERITGLKNPIKYLFSNKDKRKKKRLTIIKNHIDAFNKVAIKE